jgi:hypothetical protein
MAKIVDPDELTQGIEIQFITGSNPKKIKFFEAGNFTQSAGVSMQTLYSFCKEEWKNDSNLIKFPFPMISITSEQFEFISDWDLSGSFEKNAIRDGGWARRSGSGVVLEEWMNVTTLGAFVTGSDQAYYQQSASAAPVNFTFPGEVNAGVQLYESGAYDYRDYYKIFLREQGKTYDSYDLPTEQNIPFLTYRKYAMPLANSNDLKIAVADIGIDANSDNVADVAPYSGMSITYFTTSQLRTIGGNPYYFNVIIDGNQGTAEQIYEFVQWSLRRPTDIATGAEVVRGDTADELLIFIGNTLRTLKTDSWGPTYIDDFQTVDTNRLEFTSGSSIITFPFVAAGNLVFNDNLQNDADARYFVFFTNDDAGDNTGRDFGTQDAIIINDNNGFPITGSVATSASLGFDYDYDNNIQRGTDSSGSNVPYTAVALGLSTAQYVVTVGTLTRSTSNIISFVAALERNYSNPI